MPCAPFHPDDPMLTVPVSPEDHVRGHADAPLTLLEYGDYQCPDCARAHAIVGQALAALDARGIAVRFVFRNFPVQARHPHARHAAEAAESVAAHTAPCFWPMHDVLFERQAAWASEHGPAEADRRLAALAGSVGGDPGRVADDLATEAFAGRIRHDVEGGVRSGVHGTPAFFINGRRYEGAWQDAGTLARDLAAAAAAR